tara:strand:+ start:16894 stop:18147 length:1254 start_codon:yes stop_codon:yes gene_type:complete
MRHKLYNIHFNFYPDYNVSNRLIPEAIESEFLGMMVFASEGWSIRDTQKDELKSNFLVQTIDATDLQDATIYRFPKLDLPRQKVDVLKEKYNLSVTRNQDKADYSIISYKYLDSTLDRQYNGIVLSKEELKGVLQKMKQDDKFVEEAWIKVVQWFKLLEDDCRITVTNDYSYNQNSPAKDLLKSLLNDYSSHDSPKWNDINRKTPWYVKAEDWSKLETILNSATLVLDTDLNKFTTEDSHVFTEADYHQCLKMIEADDRENCTLALELMANCNIEKSIPYLALLFYYNNDSLRYAKNWNTVNVKSLRTRMSSFVDGLYGSQNAHGFESFIKKLDQEGALTEFAFKETVTRMFSNVISGNAGFGKNSIFDLDTSAFKLKPEWKEKLEAQNGKWSLKNVSVYTDMKDNLIFDTADDLPF